MDTGVVFIRLRRAALCCEETCEALFEMGGRDTLLYPTCPGCGGTTWVPLTSFVVPIGLAEEPVALVRSDERASATP
jgi:hypothetical protein